MNEIQSLRRSLREIRSNAASIARAHAAGLLFDAIGYLTDPDDETIATLRRLTALVASERFIDVDREWVHQKLREAKIAVVPGEYPGVPVVSSCMESMKTRYRLSWRHAGEDCSETFDTIKEAAEFSAENQDLDCSFEAVQELTADDRALFEEHRLRHMPEVRRRFKVEKQIQALAREMYDVDRVISNVQMRLNTNILTLKGEDLIEFQMTIKPLFEKRHDILTQIENLKRSL